jgi:cyclic-di-AMP phosphodiesterase PgpH
MLSRRTDVPTRFTRHDIPRLAIAAIVLIAALAVILGADIIPQPPVDATLGRLATRDIVAPKATEFESAVQTAEARVEARAAVPPQYTFTTENAIAIAAAQQIAYEPRVARVDTTFAADLTPEGRQTLLQTAIPDLSETARATLAGLDAAGWASIRTEAARVLDATLRTELRDTEVDETRTRLAGRMAGGLDEAGRMLAAEIIAPLVVPNSSFSQESTAEARDQAAAEVEPVRVAIRQDEVIVRNGSPLTATDLEKIAAVGLLESSPDVASFGGWLLLAILIVGMLLAWLWRFRPGMWHRDNVLILIGLLVVGATLALKVTADRPTLPFFLPTAAIAILLAILLDASVATMVIALVAVIGGAVNGGSLEYAAYIFLGGMAGVVVVRRGDRLQAFVQAAAAVFVVNALVVTVFSLLGARDLQGVLELWFASLVAAGGSGVAAVGTFAVLGSVFGILTVFQLLELANPSQPLLRRLLVETPGTYHHSLMVGNLSERAAEAIGADPLVTRVAAYYHDIGKLTNPLAYIENQAGGENIHDQLDPEVSARIVKQHVVDGIDLAYKARLPKALIAYIPQHHGTAIMSYFYARAKELAGPGVIIDERKFRHAGPKPQSREAALIMLADGVEASVRSLSARDETSIRAMVTRIIDERVADGQFDECDLTLRDLDQIREAFVGQLLGMYHTRIAYPQNTVVELESRRAAGGGSSGGSGPAS